MASAGDRLQIVIGAKDELTGQLRETRKEMTRLVRAANDMQRRMENGEQGLQDEYEQTRRELQRLGGEYGDLQNKQAAVNRELKELTGNTRRAHAAQKSMSGGMGKMTALFGGITAAVAGATSAFFVLGNAVNEARAANKALAQTGAALRSMGRTDRTAADIEKMLDQLSRASGIDDDALREMTNVMLTFGNVTGETFDTANQLALDLSVAFGKDLNSASVMVLVGFMGLSLVHRHSVYDRRRCVYDVKRISPESLRLRKYANPALGARTGFAGAVVISPWLRPYSIAIIHRIYHRAHRDHGED